MSTFSSVEVIGGGLIGTSIALRLAKNGSQVRVVDSNAAHAKVANSLIGSSLLAENAPIECIVVATPVHALAQVIVSALISNPECIVIDIGSIKTKVVLDVWTLTESLSNKVELRERYIPTHPMAGREVSGPDGARSDLFEGRAWAITPHLQLKETTLIRVEALVRELGAVVYRMSPEEHDRQVAMTSHLPQLLASLLASVLQTPLDLAGQGLRDMTRLAHSNPLMWAPIVEGNKGELEPLLDEIVKSINNLKDKFFSREAVVSLMTLGADGAAQVPGKHGGISRNYGSISVVIPDRAGQLAALFNHCADGGINIEDLRIEHSPGQETGLITLYVQPDELSTLNNHLSILGWDVTILEKGN